MRAPTLFLVVAWLHSCGPGVTAQTPASDPDRMRALEAEVKALKAEVAKLRAAIDELKTPKKQTDDAEVRTIIEEKYNNATALWKHVTFLWRNGGKIDHRTVVGAWRSVVEAG